MVNWETSTLEKISLNMVRGPFGGTLKKEIFVPSGYRVYEQQDAIYGKEAIGRYYITPDKYNELIRFAVADGDFLVSCSGTIGRIYRLPKNSPAGVINQALLKITVNEEQIDPDFFIQYFKWDMFQQSIIDDTQGGAMKNLIGMDKFRLTEIPLPPLPEQRRIAEVLSGMDALLAAMEKLIAKKRAIKQGAMQELLTGKRRLPGFDEKWVEKKLGEIVEIYDNLRIPVAESLRQKGLTPYYGANGIQDYVKGHTHDGEFVLLAEDGANDLLNYPVQYVNGRVWVNNHAHVIKGITGVASTRFLGHALKVVNFQSVLVGGTRAKLNCSVMRDIDMVIPKHTAEQTAIAEILSDMDAEIDALTAKLNKLRNIKQGMMNELLTGRIRLLETEPTQVAVEACKEQENQPIRFVLENTKPKGHNQPFDDAVMISGIVNALYSEKFPLGRKRVQKCLYLLRRHQEESIDLFKKMAAGPYADAVRYKGGEPIAKSCKYIVATTTKGKGTTFAPGANINQALQYIQNWEQEADIEWVVKNLKYKKTDELELLATVDMAALELEKSGTAVTLSTIKEFISGSAEWKDKLKRQVFNDAGIKYALNERKRLGLGG